MAGALSIQDCVGGVVSGPIPHACDQPLELLVVFSPLLCSFSFSLGLGFGFCSESPMAEEIVCEAEQFAEIKVCSWTDMMLVGEVRG